MDKQHTTYGNRYWLWLLELSVAGGLLVHIPELIGLFGKLDNHSAFPGIRGVEVMNEILIACLTLLLLYALNVFLFKFNKTGKVSKAKLLLSFLLGWLVSTGCSNGFYQLHQALGFPLVEATSHHYLHPLRDFVLSGFVTGSCYIIHLVHEQQRITVENQQLNLANILGQFETLKSQLNPHMLFNSLNTLRSLIREEPGKAQLYTQELSNVLRYMLHENSKQRATLAEELEFLEGYTFLIAMRYGDNLRFRVEADRQFNSHLLPPMALQVLVENAIKHNEISSRHPLTVTLATTPDGWLHVTNPIQPKITHSPGTGIGLRNLVKRYELLFNRKVEIQNSNHCFRVSIPLINPHALCEP